MQGSLLFITPVQQRIKIIVRTTIAAALPPTAIQKFVADIGNSIFKPGMMYLSLFASSI